MIIFLLLLILFKSSNNLNDSYGLLIYNYQRYIIKNKIKFINIGDYIQSIAAEQYINKKNMIYLDRDNLVYDGNLIKIIFNCWYEIYPPIKFPKNIIPLFISLHINNTQNITFMKKIFKKYEPIGARDIDTMNILKKNGIKSYFSGCLTLTLGKTFNSKIKKNIIYLVDYKFNINVLIDLEIIKILKFYQPEEIRFMSHEKISINVSHNQRFEIAKNYLKKYSQAKLIITTRLHCVLPCVGMNVPVILTVPNKNKDSRFTGLANTFLNFIGFYPNNNKFIKEILTDEKGYIINDQGYKYYSNKMEKIINNFINK